MFRDFKHVQFTRLTLEVMEIHKSYSFFLYNYEVIKNIYKQKKLINLSLSPNTLQSSVSVYKKRY